MKKILSILILSLNTLVGSITHPYYPCSDTQLNIPTDLWYPFQFSWFCPIQTTGPRDSVSLFRFNVFYGESFHVTGLDIGLCNQAWGNLNGMEFGITNIVQGNAGLLQVGINNAVNGNFTGLQLGLVNSVGHDVSGMQIGLINYSASLRGVQIGIFNTTYQVEGVQIGLINVRSCGGLCKCNVMPFINVGW